MENTENEVLQLRCTRCHSVKPDYEFGHNKKHEWYSNCIQCREKRREYKRNSKTNKQEETCETEQQTLQRLLEHLCNKISEDEMFDDYFILSGINKDRILIEICK